jgi:hypothetical protein
MVINGAMQVTQRGTSTASITTSGYYTADRWNLSIATLGTWTQSVENDAPTGSGFRKSLKMLCTTADATPSANDSCFIQQRFEGQNLQAIRKGTSSAQPLTLQFWVKSGVTGTYICELGDDDNSRQVSKSYTIDSANTWELKTISFPADATGVLDNDTERSMTVYFGLGVGTTFTSGTLNTVWASATNANRYVGQVNVAGGNNAAVNYWQITGVQLEQNLQPTPFEQRPIGVELALCQRYYYALASARVNSTKYRESDRVRGGTAFFPTTMRAAPTVTITSYDADGGGAATIGVISVQSFSFVSTATADGQAPFLGAYTASIEL